MSADLEKLRILHYPDPRLRKKAEPVRVRRALAALARRLFELMRAENGVGLAAPQVGALVRMFVMNPTGDPGDDRVIINPSLRDLSGADEAEEGCLSIPDVRVQVRRARCRLVAQDLRGAAIETEGEELIARIWQHETDHLNGVLILDRMGPADQIAVKKTLRSLEAAHQGRSRSN